jgi:hypothetical protein
LKVDNVQQRRLEQLALQDRTLHAHQRLLPKGERPLGHRCHIDGEPQPGQVLKEFALEKRLPVVACERGEILDVRLTKPERPEVLEGLPQSRGDRISAAERRLAKEQVEHGRLFGSPQLPIAVGHGELIEVRQQRQRRAVQVV